MKIILRKKENGAIVDPNFQTKLGINLKRQTLILLEENDDTTTDLIRG